MIQLPAVVQLRGYQQRWIDDLNRFCIAVKSARIGFSYATALKHVQRRLMKPKTTTTVLSASKAQSIEFVETAQNLTQAMGATAQLYDEAFADDLGATSFTQSRIQFANGSRLIALAANPRTARGYPGDVVLDEFGHCEDSYAIWAAAMRQVSLGNGADVLSTPNGEQGKYFDLAKGLELTDGVAPTPRPSVMDGWSRHWVDVHAAVAEGCPIDIEEMRAAIRDDDTFAQEFLCVFLKATGAWIPQELLDLAQDEGATIDWPTGYAPRGSLVAGIDVARDRDQTVMWLNEQIGKTQTTRMILPLHATSFPRQYELLDPWVHMTRRTAIDRTGMGVALQDLLEQTNGGRVMGISFGGTNDQGVRMKVDLAIGIKRAMEQGYFRIPYDPQIRAEFMSIKREATASGVTFEAPRIEIESAVAGAKKRRQFAHADRFWAAALANHAAQSAGFTLGISTPANYESSMEETRGFA